MSHALFVISSPLQVYCMLDAIDHYAIEHPVVYLVYGNEYSVNEGALRILDRIGVQYSLLRNYSFLYALKDACFRIFLNRSSAYFTHVFIGDYFNPLHRLFAFSYMTKKCDITFLDDGNSTVEASLTGLSLSLKRDFRLKMKFFCISLLFDKKCQPLNTTFFSFFENLIFQNCKMEINPFNSLKSLIPFHPRDNKRVVVIIGSSLASLGFIKDYEYQEYIRRCIFDSKSLFPSCDIFYFPHRAEKFSWVDAMKDIIEIKYSLETIEYELIIEQYDVVACYSFGSTAAYTLKKLFPSILSFTVEMELSNVYLNLSYQQINQYYNENGINILNGK